MAYIKADHSKLKSTASAVETYAELLEREIKTAKQDVQTLYADWQGADASQFQEKFNGITGTDSAHFATVKALKSYAEYLRLRQTRTKRHKNARSTAPPVCRNFSMGIPPILHTKQPRRLTFR